MKQKHLWKVDKMPTVDEFKSTEWTDRKPYVGLVPDNKLGGGVFYNYELIKLPNGYVWATDDDFEWKTDFPWKHGGGGAWHYIGKADKVAIPHTIHNKEVTDYEGMFYQTPVSGVYSKNPKVTLMGWMFYDSQATILDLTYLDTSNVISMLNMFTYSKATSLDLSGFDTSHVNEMSHMFSNSKATKGYARTQEDADKFNGLIDKPTTLTFVVKS